VVLVLIYATPLVPVGFAVWMYRRRRREQPSFPHWLAWLSPFTRAGRAVLMTVGLIGAELVAIDFFVMSYFNAGDEHVPSVLGVFVSGLLGAIALCDYVARGLAAAFGPRGPRRLAS
jgi:hypothetical protein